jgi:NADH:ubiquinone reductase (H+-translocating)
MEPHVVIVGGGLGGLNAAKALRRAPVRITLFDRNNYHLLQALLYQVATALLSAGDIAWPIRWIFSRQPNVRVLMGEVKRIDLARRVVSLDDEDVSYDYLVVATGVVETYFGHPEWAAVAPGLKTLDDALEIRRRVLSAFEIAERSHDEEARRRLLTFAVVGGGPTGVELAGALAEIAHESLAHDFRAIDPTSAKVILIEALPTILPTFPESLRAAARAALAKLGVQVRENTKVEAVEPGRVIVTGDCIDAATVLWAAGIKGSELGGTLGVPLDRSGRVVVNPDLSVPGHPEAFVVGDLAAFHDDGGRQLAAVAQVALQGGKHAALNIARAVRGAPSKPFQYADLGSMATIGRHAAIADLGWLRLSGFTGWLLWLVVHLRVLVGFRNRNVVLFEWIWAYFTRQRGARLIRGGRG